MGQTDRLSDGTLGGLKSEGMLDGVDRRRSWKKASGYVGSSISVSSINSFSP